MDCFSNNIHRLTYGLLHVAILTGYAFQCSTCRQYEYDYWNGSDVALYALWRVCIVL